MINELTLFPGLFEGTWQDLFNQFTRVNPEYNSTKLESLAKFYIKYSKIFCLRADLAWPQMEHETGFLKFKGIAKPEWNNFAGIGVTGPPNVGNRFKTPELGVIAHFAHLAWYYFPSHCNKYCSKEYDPRHFGDEHKYNGDQTLKRLNGAWAVPGRTYAQSIAKIANQIFASDSLVTMRESITEKIKNALNIKTDYKWQYIAIHHSVSDQYKTNMEMIKRWHLARTDAKFLREGYNFGLNGNGEIEEGRPLNMQGAHVKGWNTRAIGICLYGDFRYNKLTQKQKKSAFELIKENMRIYNIPKENILGHKEFPDQSTSCPCIDMDKFREEIII